MGGQRYPEDFKIDAVDRSHSVYSVVTRLNIATHSLM